MLIMPTKKLVSKELPKSRFRGDDLLKSKSEPISLSNGCL